MRKIFGYYLILVAGISIIVISLLLMRLLSGFLPCDNSIPNAIYGLGIICGFYISWVARFSVFLLSRYKMVEKEMRK